MIAACRVVAKHIARRNFLIIRVLARAMAFFVADESVDVKRLVVWAYRELTKH